MTSGDCETYSAFFYGSLMSKIVLLRVLCGPNVSEGEKALKLKSIQFSTTTLKGYVRSSLKGEDYPAMIHTGNEKDSFQGILAQGLTKKDIHSLDTFEGDWYQRIPVQVVPTPAVDEKVQEATPIDTEAYLYIGEKEILTYQDWSFDYFLKSGKEQKWLDDRCEFYDVDGLHA